MKTKTFHDGEILTAADVNNYLVNDPSLVENAISEINTRSHNLTQQIQAIPSPATEKIFLLYNWVSTEKNSEYEALPILGANRVIQFPTFLKLRLVMYGAQETVSIGSPNTILLSQNSTFLAVLQMI